MKSFSIEQLKLMLYLIGKEKDGICGDVEYQELSYLQAKIYKELRKRKAHE